MPLFRSPDARKWPVADIVGVILPNEIAFEYLPANRTYQPPFKPGICPCLP